MRRTSTSQKKSLFGGHSYAVTVVTGAVLILAIAGTATNWWSSIPHEPKRPSAVPENAVWIAESKSGQWVLCQVKEYGDKAQCTIWDYSGIVAYSGAFKTYKDSTLTPNKRLDINTQRTGEPRIFIHNVFVPVIFLTDHKILIPAEAYSRVIEEFANSLS